MKKLFTNCLLLALVTGSLTTKAIELTAKQQASAKLTTTTLTERRSSLAIIANGTLRADQQRLFRVAPVVDGLVTDLHVVEQAMVRKGQVLANLHSNSLGQAQSEYLEAMARFEVAQADRLRIQGLRKDGVVAESRLLESQSQYKMARALLDQRRRSLTLAGLSASRIDGIAQHTDSIADYPLVSPANGLVLEVAVESGQLLAAGETAFRLVDLSKIWADIRIPVASTPQANPGTKVIIKAPNFPNIEGQLQSLGGEVDQENQTVSGLVVIDNAQGQLRPGMYVQAELQGITQNGLMVPQSAVFRSGNDSMVFKVSGPNRYDPIKVTLGEPTKGWVPVLSGIEAGTEIVSGGVAELKSHWQYQGGK